jgi:threonine/homoserine/homoserine lactone efflux protein
VSNTEPAATILAGLGIGLALASAPGPVQAVVLGEAVNGGLARGLRAVVGASASFGLLLLLLALGVSFAAPGDAVLRALQVLGGGFLIWLAVDAVRSESGEQTTGADGRSLPAAAKGSLAVLLNPGAWLFLVVVAAPLFATAAQAGGSAAAVMVGLALMVGAAAGDCAIVVVGAAGLRRAGPRTGRLVRRILAIILGAMGGVLLASGLIG